MVLSLAATTRRGVGSEVRFGDVRELREEREAPPLELQFVRLADLQLAIGVGRVEARVTEVDVLHDEGAVTGVDAILAITAFLVTDGDSARVDRLVARERHDRKDDDDDGHDGMPRLEADSIRRATVAGLHCLAFFSFGGVPNSDVLPCV